MHDVAQTTLNGLVAGSYLALGAVGLTLVYGTLRLVNFAHGDLLTFGAYVGLGVQTGIGIPFLVAVPVAVAAGAALGLGFEVGVLRRMRDRGTTLAQMLLMTIGAAFVVRYGIQFFAGSQGRNFDVDVTGATRFLGLRIGNTQLIVMLVGLAVVAATAAMLRYTLLGKRMRALADDLDLAEVAGIDTRRIVLITWALAAGLAGLAGCLYAAAIGVMTPNLGFSLLLALFAATVLGGIGNAYGALLAGLLIALAQDWSTLLWDPRWKPVVGFGILLIALVAFPQGILGRRRSL